MNNLAYKYRKMKSFITIALLILSTVFTALGQSAVPTLNPINTGTNPNDGSGDKVREAFIKVNSNFTSITNGISANNSLYNSQISSLENATNNLNIRVSTNESKFAALFANDNYFTNEFYDVWSGINAVELNVYYNLLDQIQELVATNILINSGFAVFTEDGATNKLGYNALSESNSLAIGYNAQAKSPGSSAAIGNNSSAEYLSLAFGNAAYARAASTSVGIQTKADNFGTAIGTLATASNLSISIGTAAKANDLSTAIGTLANADSKSIAIGTNATAKNGSIVIGGGANSVDAAEAVIIGNGSIPSGAGNYDYTVVLGSGTVPASQPGGLHFRDYPIVNSSGVHIGDGSGLTNIQIDGWYGGYMTNRFIASNDIVAPGSILMSHDGIGRTWSTNLLWANSNLSITSSLITNNWQLTNNGTVWQIRGSLGTNYAILTTNGLRILDAIMPVGVSNLPYSDSIDGKFFIGRDVDGKAWFFNGGSGVAVIQATDDMWIRTPKLALGGAESGVTNRYMEMTYTNITMYPTNTIIAGYLTVTNDITAAKFKGDGSGLTSIQTTNLTGMIMSNNLAINKNPVLGDILQYSTNGLIWTNANTFLSGISVTGIVNNPLSDVWTNNVGITGNGYGLTNIKGSSIVGGTTNGHIASIALAPSVTDGYMLTTTTTGTNKWTQPFQNNSSYQWINGSGGIKSAGTIQSDNYLKGVYIEANGLSTEDKNRNALLNNYGANMAIISGDNLTNNHFESYMASTLRVIASRASYNTNSLGYASEASLFFADSANPATQVSNNYNKALYASEIKTTMGDNNGNTTGSIRYNTNEAQLASLVLSEFGNNAYSNRISLQDSAFVQGIFTGWQRDTDDLYNFQSRNNIANTKRSASLNFWAERNSISNTFNSQYGADASLSTVNLTNSTFEISDASKVGIYLENSSNINIRAYAGSLMSARQLNSANIDITAFNSIIGGKIPSNYTNTLNNEFAFFSADGTVSGIKSDGTLYGTSNYVTGGIKANGTITGASNYVTGGIKVDGGFYGNGVGLTNIRSTAWNGMAAKIKFIWHTNNPSIATNYISPTNAGLTETINWASNVLSSYNIINITNSGSNRFKLTFSNALPNANYVVTANAGTGYVSVLETTTSSVTITNAASAGGALQLSNNPIHLMIFAD